VGARAAPPGGGGSLIERVPQLADAVPAVRHHHERFDGTGYPAGLVGENIPLGARIVLVADAYDAMRADRIYNASRSSAEALIELRRHAGVQFCAHCVDALERALSGGSFASVNGGRRHGTAADESA
jgi:HD-GYP domain-containing protein (c-di-GMP phosphodiesterase class II)